MNKTFFFSLLFITYLQASFVGSPASSGLVECGAFLPNCYRFSFRLGYEADFIFDGKMKKKTTGQRVDSFEQKNFLGTLVFNFCDRFDLYGSYGESQFETDYRIFLDSGEAFCIDSKSHYSPSWAVGTSMILLDYKCVQVGWGIKYLEADSSLITLKQNGADLLEGQQDSANIHFRSLNTFFGLAFQSGFFVPYANFHLKYSKAKIASPQGPISDDGTNSITMEEKNPYGLTVGLSITNKKQMSLTIESRVISEEAITVSGSFRF